MQEQMYSPSVASLHKSAIHPYLCKSVTALESIIRTDVPESTTALVMFSAWVVVTEPIVVFAIGITK